MFYLGNDLPACYRILSVNLSQIIWDPCEHHDWMISIKLVEPLTATSELTWSHEARRRKGTAQLSKPSDARRHKKTKDRV